MSDDTPVATTTADGTPIDGSADPDPGDDHDPDGDPAMLTSGAAVQPDPAEGADDETETGRPQADTASTGDRS